MYHYGKKSCAVLQSLWVLAALFVLLALGKEVLAQEPHACDYLTSAMVEEIMGMPVLNVEADTPSPLGQSVCFFNLSDTQLRFAQVQMVCSAWPGLEDKGWTAKSLFENNMRFLDGLEDETGVGDKAYWGGSELQWGSGLHVLSDDCFFTILAMAGGDEAINRAKARELVVKVLGMLGKE